MIVMKTMKPQIIDNITKVIDLNKGLIQGYYIQCNRILSFPFVISRGSGFLDNHQGIQWGIFMAN